MENQRIKDVFDEGTFAFSDRIFGLTDDELWENEVDQDAEAASTPRNVRKPARGSRRKRQAV